MGITVAYHSGGTATFGTGESIPGSTGTTTAWLSPWTWSRSSTRCAAITPEREAGYGDRMGVLRETAAKWMRMLTIMADQSLPISEQARLISDVNGPVQLDVTLPPYRWPWQRAVAGEVLNAAGTAAGTTLNWHIHAARLTTEHLIHRLREATGEAREQILQEVSISVDRTIAAAEQAAGETDS